MYLVFKADNILSAVEGINGFNNIAPIRIDSHKLYKTLLNLSLLFSSLAKIQGVVSSIYLFVSE